MFRIYYSLVEKWTAMPLKEFYRTNNITCIVFCANVVIVRTDYNVLTLLKMAIGKI